MLVTKPLENFFKSIDYSKLDIADLVNNSVFSNNSQLDKAIKKSEPYIKLNTVLQNMQEECKVSGIRLYTVIQGINE